MSINEIKINGKVALTTRGDTVAPENLATGETATNRAGNKITGNASNMSGDGSYHISDLESIIDDDDFIPYQDVGDDEEPTKKILFTNFVNKLKRFFATITGNNINEPNTFRKNIKTIDQLGTEIPSGSDFDAYMTAGAYFVSSIITARTMTHIPIQTSGKLIVAILTNEDTTTPSCKTQFYITNHYNRIFFRNTEDKYNDGTVWEWNEWKEITKSHTYETGTEIPENADLNTYTTVGVYQCQLNVTARTMSNLPYSGNDRVAFKLIVSSTNSSAHFMQTFIPYTSGSDYMGTRIAYRLRDNDSTWGMWHHLVNTEEVHYLNGIDIAHQISANEDLNDYVTSGTYQCNHADIATTLANCPVSNSFKLVVDRAYTRSESEITQRITCQNNHSEMDWYRSKVYGSSTWDAWKQVASTDDIVTNGYAVGTVSGSAITATINGFTLKSGVIVAIKISNQIAQACTLNINSTGAKSVVFWNNENPSFGKMIGDGRVTTFIYDGTYYRVLAVDRTPFTIVQNYTANTNGNILIDWGYDVNRTQLKYNLNNDKLFWNYYKNGAWRGDVAVADYKDLITTGQTEIPADSDLNNYKACGVYKISSGAIAATVSNIPVALSGKLLVIANTNAASDQLWKTQIYLPNHESALYLRSSSDNNGTQIWLSWTKLGGTAGGYLPLSGGTLTGSALLGYAPNRTVVSGAHQTSMHTIPDIINEMRYSNGAWGSLELTTAYTLNNLTIPVGWYNYCYIPHRVGGEKWATPTTWDADNINYGQLLLFGMNNNNGMFKVRYSGGNIFEIEDLQKGNCYVGTCTTAGNVKDKEASVDGNFVLRKGVQVAIKFTNTNSYSSSTTNPITLNVNNTGAKQIWYNTNSTSGGGATGTATWIFGQASRYIYYIYDGTYWIWAGHGLDNNNTNYLPNNASATLTASGASYITIKSTTIDMKQSNNGVSSGSLYPAFIIQDKNGYDMTRVESAVNSSGTVSTFIQACNYNTNSSAHFRTGITMFTNKAQDMWYSFTNPQNVNSATGMGYAVDSRSSAVAAVTATFSRYIAAYNSVVMVKFNYDVPANATLNINGQGAKNIYVNGSLIRANVIHAGERATFVLNGNYDLVSIDKAASRELISQTLAAGATTVTFTGLPTSGNNLFDVYTSKAGLNYTAIDDSTSGQLKLTYPAQSSAVTVFLKIQQA